MWIQCHVLFAFAIEGLYMNTKINDVCRRGKKILRKMWNPLTPLWYRFPLLCYFCIYWDMHVCVCCFCVLSWMSRECPQVAVIDDILPRPVEPRAFLPRPWVPCDSPVPLGRLQKCTCKQANLPAYINVCVRVCVCVCVWHVDNTTVRLWNRDGRFDFILNPFRVVGISLTYSKGALQMWTL
jgi:hypothetical protein